MQTGSFAFPAAHLVLAERWALPCAAFYADAQQSAKARNAGLRAAPTTISVAPNRGAVGEGKRNIW